MDAINKIIGISVLNDIIRKAEEGKILTDDFLRLIKDYEKEILLEPENPGDGALRNKGN